MLSSPVTEHELAAKSTAPRVTAEDLENAIASEHYASGDYAVGMLDITNPAHGPLGLLTICILVLRNGFTVTGTSACASADNFDAEIGKRIARQDAMRQLWPLLGYQLRDRLHFAPAMEGACTVLDINAFNCEQNAPIHEAEGNAKQADLSRNNAAIYRAAIARLRP
jgi:hypothetical protein